MNNKIIKNNLLIPLIYILILIFPGILYPLLHSGYYGDDTLSSLVNSTMLLSNQSFWDRTLVNFEAMSPRAPSIFQPYFLLFLLIGGNLLYLKLWVALLLIVMLISEYILVYKITNNKVLSLCSCIFSISLIQFREYGDPILAFYGITPLSVIFLLWTIYFIFDYLENLNLRNIIAINLLSIISIQLYEYNIIIIISILMYFSYKNRNLVLIKHSSVFLSVVIMYVLLGIYLRTNLDGGDNPGFHSAYQFSNNLYEITKSFIYQIIGALPFANTIFSPLIDLKIHYLLIILVASIFLALKYKIHTISLGVTEKTGNLLPISVFLIIIPIFVISLSPKYQSEIKLGMVYTPSLYSAIGLSLLFVILLALSLNIKNLILKYCIKFLFIITTIISFLINIYSNNLVVESLNSFWHYPRSMAESAIKAGIFDNIGENPVLISGQNFPWSITPFYYEYSGIKFNQKTYQAAPGMFFSAEPEKINLLVSGRSNNKMQLGYLKEFPYLEKYFTFFDGEYYHFDFDINSNIYYFDYHSRAINTGYAFLCKIKSISANQQFISSVLCENLKIYNKQTASSTYSLNALSKEKHHLENFILNDEYFDIIKQSPNGKLLIKNKFWPNILIDPKSLRILSENRVRVESVIYDSSISSKTYFKNNLLLYEPLTWDNSGTLNLEFKYALGVFGNSFQPQFAHVIGNHPGAGWDGFIFQKKHSSQDEYIFSYGNGFNWIELATIKVTDTKVHTLKLSISKSEVILYHDGVLVGKNTALFSNSTSPLQIGGLNPGLRFFNGYIFDIKVSN